METFDTILKRRSIRHFTEEKISDEMIDKLLQSAMAGPSAHNKQPWEFYVIKDPKIQEELRGASQYTNLNSSLMIVVAGDDKRSLNHRVNDFWIQDCSAAIENMLLTATDLGLGSCWCGLFPLITPIKRVREILHLDKTIIPLALLHFGYPDEKKEARTQYDPQRVHYF